MLTNAATTGLRKLVSMKPYVRQRLVRFDRGNKTMLRGGCAIIKKCGLKWVGITLCVSPSRRSSNEFTRTPGHKRHGQGGGERFSRGSRHEGSVGRAVGCYLSTEGRPKIPRAWNMQLAAIRRSSERSRRDLLNT